MVSESRSGVGWTARVVGVLVVGLGIMQWWGESEARREPTMSGEVPGTWLDQWAVLTHALPTLVLLVALVLAWAWPLVGAVVFGGVFIASAIASAITGEMGYLVFAVPQLIAGVLFLAAWWLGHRTAVGAAAT